MSIQDVLKAIDAEIALVEQARKLLTGSGANNRGRKQPAKAKRTVSPAARKRMAEAQRNENDG